MNRDEYVAILKEAALTAAKKSVMKLLLAELPKGLVTGFIGSIVAPILGVIVGKALELAIEKTELGLFFLYIDLRTSAQGREFERMAKANFDAQKSGSEQEKANAEQALIDSFRRLAKFTN